MGFWQQFVMWIKFPLTEEATVPLRGGRDEEHARHSVVIRSIGSEYIWKFRRDPIVMDDELDCWMLDRSNASEQSLKPKMTGTNG